MSVAFVSSLTFTFLSQIVYATACAEGPATTESAYGIPFQVTYSERFSAAGRTAGSFIKRDGRPRDHEVLAARLIDRHHGEEAAVDMTNFLGTNMFGQYFNTHLHLLRGRSLRRTQGGLVF